MAELAGPWEAPRVVVALSRADYEWALYGDDRRRVEIPQGTKLVPVDNYKRYEDPLFGRLQDDGLLEPGNIIVQSPFTPERYELQDQAVFGFQREKLHLVSGFCHLLGATRVQSELSSLDVEVRERSGKLKVGRGAGRVRLLHGEAALKLAESESLGQELKLDDRFPGSPPDLVAAAQFLKEHRLLDPEISGLIQLRSGPNPIDSRTVEISFSGQRDKNLQLASKVQIPTVEGSLGWTDKRQAIQKAAQKVHIAFS